MDKTSEQHLTKLYPGLAAKIVQLHDILLKEEIVVRIVQGFRTFQEQDELYSKGRTKPGPKVTNAPGGTSYHNYGLAVDMCPGIKGKPDWAADWKSRDKNDQLLPSWKRLVEVAKSLGGLYCGSDFSWHDDGHLQMAGTLSYRKPPPEAQKLLRSEGVQAVWLLAGLSMEMK